MSRSVSQGKPVCFRVPPGTASNGRERFFQDVLRRIVVPVQNHATAMTDMAIVAIGTTDDAHSLDILQTRIASSMVANCF
jgi:hypothetical protein